jgi:hypothetical protein
MAFTDSIKGEVRRKAGYTCCICQRPNLSLEVHHIIPQKDGGPDTIDNAAPVCPTCHSDYGNNFEKAARIREMRDWLYEQVKIRYSKQESDLILKMSQDVFSTKEDLSDLKASMNEFMKLRIDQITSDTAPLIVSSIIGGTTSAAVSSSHSASPSISHSASVSSSASASPSLEDHVTDDTND